MYSAITTVKRSFEINIDNVEKLFGEKTEAFYDWFEDFHDIHNTNWPEYDSYTVEISGKDYEMCAWTDDDGCPRLELNDESMLIRTDDD